MNRVQFEHNVRFSSLWYSGEDEWSQPPWNASMKWSPEKIKRTRKFKVILSRNTLVCWHKCKTNIRIESTHINTLNPYMSGLLCRNSESSIFEGEMGNSQCLEQYGITVVLNDGGSGGGSPNLTPNSIMMVLVGLDVHQIVGYHYFDHHQPSRGSSVRLL